MTKENITKAISKIGNVISTIFLIILIIIVGLIVYQRIKNKDEVPNVLGYRLLHVLSGSMSGQFEVGDVILIKDVKNENELKKQDIITFVTQENILVTHRIVDIKQDINGKRYITRGDVNNTEDTQAVLFSQIEGKYICKFSWLGKIINLFYSPQNEIS